MVPSLRTAGLLVVKIGSALVVDGAQPREAWLAGVAHDIAAARARGTQVIVVSSGAIALARGTLGLGGRRLRLEEKQAAAAVGQIRLAQAWAQALAAQGLVAAQLLLTLGDTEDRRRYLNARATLRTLLGFGCVPVINENDSVATAEIRFGDNDRLAARVAEMVGADQLLLLSDIDGLYTADPRLHPAAVHVPVVAALSPEIEAMGGEPPPGFSSGGMRTKLIAARIATQAGCAMAIALGGRAHPIAALAGREAGQADADEAGDEGRAGGGDALGDSVAHEVRGRVEGKAGGVGGERTEGSGAARCTWFLPAPDGRSARKRWIAGSLRPAGVLRVDAGAVRALRAGGSLLPAGVVAVEGVFARGDAVRVAGPAGELGRGLSAYASEDAVRIAGRRSEDIEGVLGWRGRDEMVHRDDLVLGEDARPGAPPLVREGGDSA